MGRWGEEEKKTANLFGCFMGVLILGGFIFAFSRWYPIQEGRKQMEEVIQDVATKAHRRTQQEVFSDILQRARELDLPITKDQLKVEKSRNKEGTSIIIIDLQYEEFLDLGVYQRTIPLMVHREVPLIEF
jgi:hypothetical protein